MASAQANMITEHAAIEVSDSLKSLQSNQQQQVLDTVDELRKCGLESLFSLPQLVVCGDQSAGKSSVLEALTEISFPAKDNLCTRFATEIVLRRATEEGASVKIVPDKDRDVVEQAAIKKFGGVLSDFNDLPDLIDQAANVMGIGEDAKTFSNDLLSIEIAGPGRPQLTVVDLPGLIQNGQPGDVSLVRELTKRYISSPRTICLAVISATHDHANQGILQLVRNYDKDGDRTLGIITKPDRLEKDSGSERSYMALARNAEVFLKLGWHVLKNRSFAEGDITFSERNANESLFFRASNWKTLPNENVGIDELRKRLSMLLFAHVKGELPKLRDDIELALGDVNANLTTLGADRSSVVACKDFLLDRGEVYSNTCRAAEGGHYDDEYFAIKQQSQFQPTQLPSLRRLRAAVQELNVRYSKEMRLNGHKFKIGAADKIGSRKPAVDSSSEPESMEGVEYGSEDDNSEGSMFDGAKYGDGSHMTHDEALNWVKETMKLNRGKELSGNFNPLLIGELFKSQSSQWCSMAYDHVCLIEDVCSTFLEDLLKYCCPADVQKRLWMRIEEQLSLRKLAALEELGKLTADLQAHPINYNHYYTDTISKRANERQMRLIAGFMKSGAQKASDHAKDGSARRDPKVLGADNPNMSEACQAYVGKMTRDMERHSCEQVLDCVQAIYKLQLKTFIANVTTQVIERHIIRDIEKIFSPVVVSKMSEEEVRAVALEPPVIKHQRELFTERSRMLQHGQSVLRKVMRIMPA